MSQPVNGHGAVDLAAVKSAAEQRAQLELNREQVERQLLTQAGLQCPCGERLRSEQVIYYAIVEQQVPTPAGPQLAVNVVSQACCSRTCGAALACEAQAIARRSGPAGAIVWLDERRAARAAANQG